MPSPQISGLHPDLPRYWSAHAALDFVNSRFLDHLGSEREFDRLPSRVWRDGYLLRIGWGSKPIAGSDELAALATFRARLRSLLENWSESGGMVADDLAWVNSNFAAAPTVLEAVPTGALTPSIVRRDWAGVRAQILFDALDLMRSGEPDRLKICDNPHCSWMFYDGTRNRIRRWCDPGTCGNLVKVREHRARRGPTDSSSSRTF